ncbi:MAG: proline racemase family protein [Cyclobacteriaceae bacterium]
MTSVYSKIQKHTSYQVPDDWLCVKTMDMHTAGEPLRVITAGFPELKGANVLERRAHLKQNYDHLRTALMLEPRGHRDMYGCILLPPDDKDADFGILFMHNEGYSTMCGHAIIAVTKLAVKMGWVEPYDGEVQIKIDAPCGRITSFASLNDDELSSVHFYGVPSFLVELDQKITLAGFGEIKYDLAYGGAFYAYVDADHHGVKLEQDNYHQLIQLGKDIKREVIRTNNKIKHPFEKDLSFLYGTIFISNKTNGRADSRNVCIFANGEVDRSPTGSGVSGRMAIHHARSEIQVGQPMVIESIIGTTFNGSVIQEVSYGPYQAVIPRVEGTAYVVGQNEFIIDPNDPLKDGFVLG